MTDVDELARRRNVNLDQAEALLFGVPVADPAYGAYMSAALAHATVASVQDAMIERVVPAVCEHDWRLASETPTIAQKPSSSGRFQGFEQTGWKRRWYCVRCRTVEETKEELGG